MCRFKPSTIAVASAILTLKRMEMESFCGEWWKFLHEYAVFEDLEYKVVDFNEIETCLNLLVMHYERIQSELLLLEN